MNAEQARPFKKFAKRTEQRVCAYCREDLEASPWLCPLCQSALHAECAAEIGRCPSIGCSGGAGIATDRARPASDISDHWRIRDPGLSGLTITNSREACRLSFAMDRVGGRGVVMWRAGLRVKIPLALVFFVVGLSCLYARAYIPGLLAIFLALRVFKEPDEQGGRPRVLTMIAGPESWELLESFLDGSEPVSLQVTRDKGQALDDRDLERNLIHIGGHSLRLPKRPAAQQRRLFDELQRAWRAER